MIPDPRRTPEQRRQDENNLGDALFNMYAVVALCGVGAAIVMALALVIFAIQGRI